MCQDNIIKYLIKKNGKKVDIVNLCLNIPANRSNISRACRKLREQKEIRYRKVKIEGGIKYVYFV